MNKYVIYIMLFVIFFSCEKEEVPEKDSLVSISGRSINYTLQVILADEYTKSTNFVINAKVQISTVNGIKTQMTDSSGRVSFSNIASGIVLVSVSYENYTSAEMQVNLLQNYGDTAYDSNNIRNVSTMVKLFPTSGDNLATIKGKVWADLNLANDTGETYLIYKHKYEPVQSELKYFINVNTDQFVNNNTDKDGEIINIVYSGFNISDKSDNQGNFEIKVPSSLSGLEYEIVFSDFEFDQTIIDIYPNTISERKIFYSDSILVKTACGSKDIVDIFYNY